MRRPSPCKHSCGTSCCRQFFLSLPSITIPIPLQFPWPAICTQTAIVRINSIVLSKCLIAHNSFCLQTNLSDFVVWIVRHISNTSKQKRKRCCEINGVNRITCKFSVSKNCQVLQLKFSYWYSWDLLITGAHFTFVHMSDTGPSPHSIECCHEGHRAVHIPKTKVIFFFSETLYTWPVKVKFSTQTPSKEWNQQQGKLDI